MIYPLDLPKSQSFNRPALSIFSSYLSLFLNFLLSSLPTRFFTFSNTITEWYGPLYTILVADAIKTFNCSFKDAKFDAHCWLLYPQLTSAGPRCSFWVVSVWWCCSAVFLRCKIGFCRCFFGLVLMDCISLLNGLSRSSDFNGRFLVFGFSSPALNALGLLLLFVLSLKLLQFSCSGEGLVQFLCGVRGKSVETRDGLDSKKGLDEGRDLKIVSCECDSVNLLENSKSRCKVGSFVRNEVENFVTSDVVVVDDDDNASDCCPEDEEFDVTVLRKMVKSERQRANEAYAELEKERVASASAAEEAMSMVLRLQSAKSSMEIEANQYRKWAEKKQDYDQEVIQSLRWIITKHESERNVLVEKLRLCRGNLKQYRSSDEMDHFEGLDATLGFMDSAVEDGLVDNGKWQ